MSKLGRDAAKIFFTAPLMPVMAVAFFIGLVTPLIFGSWWWGQSLSSKFFK